MSCITGTCVMAHNNSNHVVSKRFKSNQISMKSIPRGKHLMTWDELIDANDNEPFMPLSFYCVGVGINVYGVNDSRKVENHWRICGSNVATVSNLADERQEHSVHSEPMLKLQKIFKTRINCLSINIGQTRLCVKNITVVQVNFGENNFETKHLYSGTRISSTYMDQTYPLP